MAAEAILTIMLLTLACAESHKQGSVRNVYRCEGYTTDLTCEKYPGTIEIWDVQFPKKNADFCGNFNSPYKKNECLATESDEKRLKSELEKYCNDKRFCNIHLAHGPYRDIHLPCRDLNISIRIEIFYYCISAPVVSTSTHSSTEPPKTESSPVSMATLPSFRSTKTMIETSIPVSKTAVETSMPVSETAISSETTVTATVSPTTTDVRPQWSRRRPRPCNLTDGILDDDPVESNTSDFCSSFSLVIFDFTWLLVLVKY